MWPHVMFSDLAQARSLRASFSDDRGCTALVCLAKSKEVWRIIASFGSDGWQVYRDRGLLKSLRLFLLKTGAKPSHPPALPRIDSDF
jgi:hypothetical protein